MAADGRGGAADNSMFGLVDCNNFFVSCERVFNPSLCGRPVVVLSSNDGCIIARSNEAKALGIAMGEPYFKARRKLEDGGVAIYSGNHVLYGDMSRRVMSLLSEFAPEMEIYSIDEAFLHLDGIPSDKLRDHAAAIVRAVRRGTGIPVTIGLAPTKTLAKVAAYFGKRYPAYHGVCLIDDDTKRMKALMRLPIGEVWGVGRRYGQRLRDRGIETAWDFVAKPENWVRREMSVTGVRTWRELRGLPCIERDDNPDRKSLCTSRSFSGHGICDLAALEEAVADYASDSAARLRRQHSVCSSVTLYVRTDRFNTDVPAHVIHSTACLQTPTSDAAEIVGHALAMLRRDYRPGFYYKKAGVTLWNITSETIAQADLFDPIDRIKQRRIMQAVDDINRKNGKNFIRLGTQMHQSGNHVKSEHRSRRFTTNLQEIITVFAGDGDRIRAKGEASDRQTRQPASSAPAALTGASRGGDKDG